MFLHIPLFSLSGVVLVFFVVKSDSGHKVMEMGSLSFGLSLAKGLNQFYEAISYIPPHGFQSAH